MVKAAKWLEPELVSARRAPSGQRKSFTWQCLRYLPVTDGDPDFCRHRHLGTTARMVKSGTWRLVSWERVRPPRHLQHLLHRLDAVDPSSYLGVATLAVVVFVAAAYIPARRVTKIDPMTVISEA